MVTALTDAGHSTLTDMQDELQVIERPQPYWPLARVCNLLYGMEGAASSPRGYALPGFGTERGDTAPMALGGGAAAIRSKWQGT